VGCVQYRGTPTRRRQCVHTAVSAVHIVRALLRYAELERRGVIDEPGDILMDVPASTANGDLVDMAGGFGTAEHREAQRLHWRGMCKRRMADVDRTRQVMREDLLAEIRKSVTANTAEETSAALLNTEHSWRIYSDGGM
jgi:hypothetical protein